MKSMKKPHIRTVEEVEATKTTEVHRAEMCNTYCAYTSKTENRRGFYCSIPRQQQDRLSQETKTQQADSIGRMRRRTICLIQSRSRATVKNLSGRLCGARGSRRLLRRSNADVESKTCEAAGQQVESAWAEVLRRIDRTPLQRLTRLIVLPARRLQPLTRKHVFQRHPIHCSSSNKRVSALYGSPYSLAGLRPRDMPGPWSAVFGVRRVPDMQVDGGRGLENSQQGSSGAAVGQAVCIREGTRAIGASAAARLASQGEWRGSRLRIGKAGDRRPYACL